MARNMEAIGVADYAEAFGLTEDDLRKRSPRELIGEEAIAKLKKHGYMIVQIIGHS